MNYLAISTIAALVFSSSVSAQQIPAPLPEKEWTVLVYLNADNNLESFGFDDVHEMEKVGSSDKMNIVVQFDGIKKPGTSRLYVEKSTMPYENSETFHSTVIEEMPEQDMGSAQTLIDFTEWGMKQYPAKHTMLIVWNHGSGWKKEADDSIKGISYDDTNSTHITTRQFADALTTIHTNTQKKIDILGFDACLMAMVEVIDPLVPNVDYVVASEETIPGPGYAYDKFLGAFLSRENLSVEAMLADLVKEYGLSYSGGSQGTQAVTLSALDLSQMANLKEKMNAWIRATQANPDMMKANYLEEANATLSFYDSDYRDLGNYISKVMSHQLKLDASGAQAAAHANFYAKSIALLDAIDAVVVENFKSKRFSSARGLSVYLPYGWGNWSPWNSSSSSDQRLKAEYQALSWGAETSWPQHLDVLFPASSASLN